MRVMADALRYLRGFVNTNVWDDEERSLLLESIDAALTGKVPTPAVPKGWQLVPVEPTKAMREAFHEAHEEWESGDDWRLDSPDHQWRAMLSASPKPEAK